MIQKSLEFNFSVTNKRHVKIKYATNSKPCGILKAVHIGHYSPNILMVQQ